MRVTELTPTDAGSNPQECTINFGSFRITSGICQAQSGPGPLETSGLGPEVLYPGLNVSTSFHKFFK